MLYTMKDGIVDKAKDRLLGKTTGLSTGFSDLDNSLEGGFQKGLLYVLGARTGMGKTSFALSLTSNICKQGKRVLYYSLQMNAENLIKRLIMLESANEVMEYDSAIKRIGEYPLFVDDAFETVVEEMDEVLKKVNDASPSNVEDEVDLIVIDYLQLLRARDCQTVLVKDKCEYLCKKLKRIAFEKQIPILLLANLPRALEQRKDKRPILSDFCEYDSAAIYGDIIMFLYRDDYYDMETEYKGIAEIEVAKNVTGVGSCCELAYVGFGHFCSLLR